LGKSSNGPKGAVILAPTVIPTIIEATPTLEVLATPTPDPTAGWQSYTNTKYSFQFKYPSNYYLSDKLFKLQSDKDYSSARAISIIKEANKEEGQPPTIYLNLIETQKSLQEFIGDDHAKEINDWQSWKQASGLDAVEPKILSIEGIQLNSVYANKVERERIQTAPNHKETQYLFKKNNLLFVFSVNYGTLNPDTKEDGSDEKKTLDQILATFRLLE